jgi:hypothetical protein
MPASQDRHRDPVRRSALEQPHVEELLQALVDDGWELTGPPPRHEPPPPFAALEREIATAFPALAKVGYPMALQALYGYVLPFLDCSLVWFEASPAEAPLRGLRTLVFDAWWPEEIAGQGLLAVAMESTGCALCLDARVGGSPEVWPVVRWDDSWRQVTTGPLFSSAERMLACLTDWWRGGRIADWSAIDPRGSAAHHYDFLDT